MRIKYLGHSAVIIKDFNFKAIIDPFISENPKSNYNEEDLEGLTHIFVTHGHGDHLGDTVELAKKYNSKVITNFEIANYLEMKEDIDTHPMHIGGRTNFDFGTVKMTPALHGSGIYTENGFLDGGNPGGFVIDIKGKKVYHAGDTGLTMDMKLLEIENIDIALLPIGGNFTMDIDDAVRAVEFINPKKVIPIHYKTFDVIDADPREFKDKVKKSKVKILDIGEEIEI